MKNGRTKRVGDIFVVESRGRGALIQYTYEHPDYGSLVRALGTADGGIVDAQEVDAGRNLFFCYFPLGGAIREGVAQFVTSAPVPPRFSGPQKMRRAGARAPDGRALTWVIESPEGESVVKSLTAEESALSIAAIWNDTLLVERIHAGWSPDQCVE